MAPEPLPPVDWAARLDERGYHMTPTRMKDSLAKWACETRDVFDDEDEKTYTEGDTVIVYEEWPGRSNFIVIGDGCVYVFDEAGTIIDEPAEFDILGKQMAMQVGCAVADCFPCTSGRSAATCAECLCHPQEMRFNRIS